MTPAAVAITVAIFVALFGVCVGLGAYIARSTISRVDKLEAGDINSMRKADSLEGRVLIIEGKVWVLEGNKRVRIGHEEPET